MSKYRRRARRKANQINGRTAATAVPVEMVVEWLIP
jgi:hypothetical protein